MNDSDFAWLNDKVNSLLGHVAQLEKSLGQMRSLLAITLNGQEVGFETAQGQKKFGTAIYRDEDLIHVMVRGPNWETYDVGLEQIIYVGGKQP